jgi:hypothetical protein
MSVASRRDILRIFGSAAASVVVAPAVLRTRAWAAVAPTTGGGKTRVLGSTGIRVATVGMGEDTRRATEGPGDVVDTTSRSPTDRNAVGMPVSAAVAGAW